MKFSAAEVADAYERGYLSGFETAITRAAAMLHSSAMEYEGRGEIDAKAIVLGSWVYVLSLHTDRPEVEHG